MSDLPPVPPGGTRRQISKGEFDAAANDQLAPENYAGEGMFSTDEYAVPDKAMDPWTQSRIGREEDYWPAPRRRR